MNNISCLLITTTVRERYHLQRPTVLSIEAANDKNQLAQKIMSVDVIEGHPYDLTWFQQYIDLGWEIVFGPCSGHRGMANNIMRGLELVHHPMLFYCEDDVIIQRIPEETLITNWFYNSDMGRKKLGVLVYNTHILAPWIHDEKIIEQRLAYINKPQSYFMSPQLDDMYLKKDPEILKDEYWICFPTCIMTYQHFKDCLEYAYKNCEGMGIEPAMSKAWWELGHQRLYDVGAYINSLLLKKLGRITFQDAYDYALFRFWNNDKTLQHPSWNNRKNTIF